MTRVALPFEQLVPGVRFESEARVITEADVVRFADVTGDHNPLHIDADWAAASPFGERIAHGMLVLSAAIGQLGFDPVQVLALRRVRDATFKRPVRLGDTITVQATVDEARPFDDRAGLVTFALRVVNQRGELVCRAAVEALWRRERSRERERARC